MSVRVTQNQLFRNITADINANYRRIFDTQIKIGAQKRVIKPSDDPVAIAQILEFRRAVDDLNQFDRNIDQARRFLQASDSALNDAHDILTRAKQLAISAANTPLDEAERQAMAYEVEEIQNELVKLANTQFNGQYLFGGSNTDTAPFSVKTLSENVSDTGNTRFRVVVYSGQGIDVSDANDIDTDSLAAGSTDEMPDATSAVSAGNIANAVYHPGTGAPVATFGSGSVQNQARVLSRFFDAVNIQVTFGSTGKVQINETGRIFTGDGSNDDGDSSVNVFRALDDLRIALENNSLGAGGIGGVQQRITELDFAMERVREAQSRIGSRVNRVEQAEKAHETVRIASEDARSKQEDLDVAAALTELQLAQTIFQAALASASRIMGLSLLNFL
ncbi:MAG: flagellar hook-associated protein FlgL [Nitrospirae bacterium]|nr:flagellar hook-associated protein FlgL [Nitrospirota bacterium]